VRHFQKTNYGLLYRQFMTVHDDAGIFVCRYLRYRMAMNDRGMIDAIKDTYNLGCTRWSRAAKIPKICADIDDVGVAMDNCRPACPPRICYAQRGAG